MSGRAGGAPAGLHVGLRPPHDSLTRGTDTLRDVVRRAEQAGFDHLTVGDHVTFRGGSGTDGLVAATALLAASQRIDVHTGVYLLPLRHPVPVARQVVTLAALAPGRFVFGVGIGGEDRDEVRACGVDPASRGRRMDEALTVLRGLLSGEPVTFHGEHLHLDDVRIVPAPANPVPIVVGGRSTAALRRAGRHGDGWLGVWVSPERFAAAVAEVQKEAAVAGRADVTWRHGVLVWCGLGRSRDSATGPVRRAMEAFYGITFERFGRYVPAGTPEEVAEAVLPYVGAGCRDIHLLPVPDDATDPVEAAAAVRQCLLDATRS